MPNFKNALAYLSRKSYQVLFYNDPLDSTDRTWGKQDFLNAYEISLYTNRAIDKRAEKVSEIEFYLVHRKSEQVVDDHPILTLLNRPNQFHTGRQFWGLYQKYKDLLGSAYIWMEPQGASLTEGKLPKALHLLRPDLVKINYGTTGIESYTYHPPRGNVITFPEAEVVYSFNPDPKNPTEGLSLLKAGSRSIDTEVQLARYHAAIIRNGGKIETVLKFKTPGLTKQQLTELKQQYEQQFSESKNSGKPMFLGGDADIVKIGLNPAELAYLESKRVILNDIAIMTGVPVAILGVPSGETFSNADASIDIFLRETIKPLLTDLTSLLDWRMVPEEFDLEFVDPTPENIDLKLKAIDTGMKHRYMTINEAREREGLEPIADGDRLPEPRPEPQFEPQERSAPSVHPLRNKAARDRHGVIMEKRMTRNEGRLLSAMRDYFLDQRRRMVASLQGVRVYRRKDLIDEAFNRDLEITLARGVLLPLIRDVLKRSGSNAVELAGATRPFVLSSTIETWLDQRANLFAEEITDTTFNRLKDAFRASLEEGESRQQLIDRIRDVYDSFDENRARTIARTEVHAATQEGTHEGYKQAGMSTKIWVSVADHLTRETHLDLDGEEVPIEHPFSNGLMYPGDPAGPAEETINCRCSI